MRRTLLIVGAALLVVLIAALIVPMWVMTAHVGLTPAALAAVVFMIIGCFAVGGGLMLLVFYSARKGYDDRVGNGWHSAEVRRDPPDTA
jgi:peptidoglycan/LPS O-acetylase OafA/YrhL